MAWRRIPDLTALPTVLSHATAETIVSTELPSQQATSSVILPSSERYRVESEIGRGGMGVVYRGVDTLLNRPVALKSLSVANSRDKQAVERFVREAQALAKLTHPSIVQVYDLADLDGELFIAMEYVEGKDLAYYLKTNGEFALKDTLTLGIDMAKALAYAHSRGIIHRDFKPGNVLLTSEKIPKVMDFGLAKIAREPSVTAIGTVLGSPNYMSPEQTSGSPTDVRTDIYALGITLFEMLTGEPPFVGETLHVMMQHAKAPPPDLRDKVTNAPESLAELLTKMLAKDPGDRCQNMDLVARSLEDITQSIESTL